MSVTIAGAAFAGREGHGLVVHEGSLWLAGGSDGDGVFADVWRSGNGSVWVSVSVAGTGFAGREGHGLVSYRGSLWVVGGLDEDGGYLGDVWRSADGGDWVAVSVATPAFVGRKGHQVAVYGGSLWVAGGRGEDGVLADVWRSGNGGDWVSVAVAAPAFAGREGHQVVAHTVAAFVYPLVPLTATGPAAMLSVSSVEVPVPVATVATDGGVGGLRFEIVDAQGVAAVDGDGVVVATSALEEGARATVSVVVMDWTPVNRATVAVTMVYYAPLSLAQDAAEYLVSPGFIGAVHSLAVRSGFGAYAFERVAGAAAFEVDAAGRVSVVRPLLKAGVADGGVCGDGCGRGVGAVCAECAGFGDGGVWRG